MGHSNTTTKLARSLLDGHPGSLYDAARTGSTHLVSQLLAVGAPVNAQVFRSEYGNALQAAAANGNFETVQQLIEHGADANASGGWYGCALQAAVCNGCVQTIKALIYSGADVNFLGGRHGSALKAAIECNNRDALVFLLCEGALVEVGSHPALQVAAWEGNVRMLDILLEHGANIDHNGGKYGTALIAAAYSGSKYAVEHLIRKGANVTLSGPYGNAVCAAAWAGAHEILERLITAGASVKCNPGKYGNPLQIASWRGNRKAVHVLISNGAVVDNPGIADGSVLQAAAWTGSVEIMQDLFQAGADINITARESSRGDNVSMESLLPNDALGNIQRGIYGTALQAAAWNGNSAAVEFLLRNGAAIDDRGGAFGTALQAAAWAGHMKIATRLIDAGADVNAPEALFGTALQAAAWNGDINLVERLISKKANVDTAGTSYGSALKAAVKRGRRAIVELLATRGAVIHNSAHMIRQNPLTSELEDNPLKAAVRRGDVEAVCQMLRSGMSPDILCGDVTILQLAIEMEHVELVAFLSLHADVNQRSPGYANALQAAASVGNLQLTEMLVRHSDVNAQGGRYGSVLQAAVVGGNKDIVKVLLNMGANVNIQAGEFASALQAASWGGNHALAALLLANGADAHIQGGRYGSALRAAAMGRHTQTMRLLISSSTGSVTKEEVSGYLHDAAWSGELDLVWDLIHKGADVNIKGGTYGNPLLAAISTGKLDVVKLLLRKGARLLPSYHDGITPLHAAARYPETMDHILKAGADIYASVKDDFGQTPLHAAARTATIETLEMLRPHVCDNLNPKDLDGRTPLHHAVEVQSLVAVKWLLDNGAAADDRDLGDQTPFQRAFDLKQLSILKVLFPHSFKESGTFQAADWRRVFGMQDDVLMMTVGGTADFAIMPAVQFQREFWPSPSEFPSFQRLPRYLRASDGSSSTSLVILQSNQRQQPWSTPGLHLRWWRRSLISGTKDKKWQLQSRRIPSATTIARVHSSECFLECRHSLCVLGEFEERDVPAILHASLHRLQRRLDIAWIMTKPERTTEDSKAQTTTLQNRAFFSTLEHAQVPASPIELLNALVAQLGSYWDDVCDAVEGYLITMRAQIYRSSGDAGQFRSLLKDAELRGTLGDLLGKQVQLMRRTHDSLHDKKTAVLQEAYTGHGSSLTQFKDSISDLETRVGEKLENLTKLSQDLIQLEFNLTSIAETQKSISMNRSMKRLSWITFIFLPLMFISSLFGMNIDILASNARWWIYIPLAAGTMVLTFTVWIVFKRNDGLEDRLERRFGWLVMPRGARDEENAYFPSFNERQARTQGFSALGKKRS